jgi:hypothetical protein
LTQKGYQKYQWRIGAGVNALDKVCRSAFMIAYDITPYTLDMLCGLINVGARNSDSNLNDNTNSSREKKHLNEIVQFAANHGIKLSVEQLAALQIPNTPMATETYSWMDFYFNLVGDSIPNSDGEIHLEPISILTIYKEYKDDMIGKDYNYNAKDVCTETEFAKLWKVCFPHVKIREFKAVTGKCNTCAHLSKKKTRTYMVACVTSYCIHG